MDIHRDMASNSLPDGTSYDGDWIDGRARRHGNVERLADGSRYDGEFADGVRSGTGSVPERCGPLSRRVGRTTCHKVTGRFEYLDGASYDGEWFGGRRNGFGIV